MAYTPTTSAGRVRMLIGDTNDSSYIFTDAEITAMLALAGNNVFTAAALCCRSLAACSARSAIAFQVLSNEFRVDKKSIPKYYLDLADKFDAQAELGDTTDYFVDWNVLISRVDGRDESDYAEDDNEEYFQNHFWEGDM